METLTLIGLIGLVVYGVVNIAAFTITLLVSGFDKYDTPTSVTRDFLSDLKVKHLPLLPAFTLCIVSFHIIPKIFRKISFSVEINGVSLSERISNTYEKVVTFLNKDLF